MNLKFFGRISLSARTAALLLLIVFTNPATVKGAIMKKIQLANNRGVALISDKHFGLVSKHKWSIQQTKHTSYAISHIYRDGKSTTIYMHRIILGLKKGDGK